jgi:hypothetical protein
MSPITESSKTGQKSCNWTLDIIIGLDELKKTFIKCPISNSYDPYDQYILEIDASEFTLGTIWCQQRQKSALDPIIYQCRTFTPYEMNYEVHDAELQVIVDWFNIGEHRLNNHIL